MTTLDPSSICWAVLAPLPEAELERISIRQWKREFPFSTSPPPREIIAGQGDYAAIICRSPGAESGDRDFASIASRLAKDRIVYSLWFDAERQEVFAWKNGEEIESARFDPAEVARSVGFSVAERAIASQPISVALVEGASIDDVRHALRDMADESWIRITGTERGILISATDGPLGTQAWDAAERLPTATVYYVSHDISRNEFSVLVLEGTTEVGRFSHPSLEGDAPSLRDIAGARSPDAIVRALRIPPELLGLPESGSASVS